MHRFFLPIILGLFSAACGSPEAPLPGSPKRLEFSIYINGDNDLIQIGNRGQIYHQGEVTFQQWIQIAETSPAGSSFNLYFDSNSAIQGRYNGTFLRRYRDGQLLEEQSFEETNSADAQWIEMLLPRKESPNTLRTLIFWGHGSGWRDLDGFDFSHPGTRFDYLSQAELLGTKDVDLVIFDACAMAYVETLSAFHTQVPYLIASQFELPVEGIRYSGLSALNFELLSDPALSKKQMAERIYNELNQQTQIAQQGGSLRSPLVLFKLEGFERFRVEFSKLIRALEIHLNPSENGMNWRQATRRLRPRASGAVLSDPTAIDLRRSIQAMAETAGFDRFAIESAFSALAHENFGSLQYFLSDPFSAERDAEGKIRANWNLELENWNLIRHWIAEKTRSH